jgi:hypothetical protein
MHENTAPAMVGTASNGLQHFASTVISTPATILEGAASCCLLLLWLGW